MDLVFVVDLFVTLATARRGLLQLRAHPRGLVRPVLRRDVGAVLLLRHARRC